MLTIRDAQMKTLEQEIFYRWVTDYLQKCYPQRTGEIGSPGLRKLAVSAIKRAHRRGYESSDSVLKYVHATFLLGSDLETSPAHAWARRILDDPDITIPAERVAALEEAIVQRLEGARAEAHQGS